MELKLKELLKKRGYSQTKLAQYLKVSNTIVSLWCANKITPSKKNLVEIANFLRCDIKQLLK